jgi:exosortase A-associated hydrolase 1
MAAAYDERGLIFGCGDEMLVGVLACPAEPIRRGVLIVVGGPQYRVGSHRQFVLLARYLAAHGIASLRFDYRGMGDSTGALRNFEHVSADIRAAMDAFVGAVPEVTEVVLWGLCDAASAAVFYARSDARVAGLVLLNPWVRTEKGEAKAYLKHYYLKRVVDPAFWRKALGGRLELGKSLGSLAGNIARAASGRSADQRESGGAATEQESGGPLPERMRFALSRFQGKVLLILSGNDLTAKEFIELTSSSPAWRSLLEDARVTRVELPEANHTFSTRGWRDEVAARTRAWIEAPRA